MHSRLSLKTNIVSYPTEVGRISGKSKVFQGPGDHRFVTLLLLRLLLQFRLMTRDSRKQKRKNMRCVKRCATEARCGLGEGRSGLSVSD